MMIDRKALICMFMLSLQFGLQPTLTKTFTPDGVCRSTVVLVQEGLKFCFAYIMLRISGERQSAVVGKFVWRCLRMQSCLWTNRSDWMIGSFILFANFIGWTPKQWIRVAFLPAALYSLQNMAALQAYQHLDSLTFNVLNRKFFGQSSCFNRSFSRNIVLMYPAFRF